MTELTTSSPQEIITTGGIQDIYQAEGNTMYDFTLFIQGLASGDQVKIMIDLWDAFDSSWQPYDAGGMIITGDDLDKAKKFNWTFHTKFRARLQQTAGPTGKSLHYIREEFVLI